MTPHLQEFIHRFEVGEGARWLRGAVALLAFLVVAGLYVLFEYENLSRPTAMDAAQVARQIARGEGFTTRFIRPFSIRLLEERAVALEEPTEDSGRLHEPHPDLANPPLYPLLLAAVMKVLAPDFQIASPGQFVVHGPDRLVVLVNLILLLGLAAVTYTLARRLFDNLVAGLATLAVVGAEGPWRTAATGEAGSLATLLVMVLALCLIEYDAAARNENTKPSRVLILAALAGVVTGLAGLTAYGLLMLALPVSVLLFPGLPGRRWSALTVALLALTVTTTPWLVRNYQLSGRCFGTASAIVLRDSAEFPGDRLERSLTANTTPGMLRQQLSKIPPRLSHVFQDDLPRAGGSWIAAFFFVGLIFSFSDPTRNLLRGFTLLGMLVLVPFQALLGPGAADSSAMPGTDYLMVLGPLILVFGTAFFVSLLEHVDWPVEGIRGLVVSVFCVVAVAPVALMLLPPGRDPSTFPPYHPPLIQKVADWVEPEEVMMSDIPWAVAWYSDRTCLWLTQQAVEPRSREDFYAVHDFRTKVVGVYLTQSTAEKPFFRAMLDPQHRREAERARAEAAGEPLNKVSAINAVGWPEFVHRSLTTQWLPAGFPLRSASSLFLTSRQLLVLDSPRWNRDEKSSQGGDNRYAEERKEPPTEPSQNP
jgi:hypothetical protein